LLTIGASLNETTTFNWNPQLRAGKTLIQLDIDVDRIGRSYPVDIPLVGDAQTILVELVYHIHRLIREGREPASAWPSEPAIARGHERYDQPKLRTSDASPLTPQRWRVEILESSPDARSSGHRQAHALQHPVCASRAADVRHQPGLRLDGPLHVRADRSGLTPGRQ
jgi:thiamine pyrophosphate-dependent acetolactate synthase large subunit-like protein